MRSGWRVWLKCFLTLVVWFQLVYAAPADSDTPSSSHSFALTSSNPPHVGTIAGSSSSDPRVTPSGTRAPDGDDVGDASQTAFPHRPTSSKSTVSLVIPSSQHHIPHTSWSRTSPSHPLTHPFPPSTPTSPAASPPRPSRHSQSTVAIVFEVLAGAAGLFIVLALARCMYSYRRTPPRDRIGALLNRHQLEREMEEMERARMERFSRTLEAYRWRPPPPPYQPSPAYESVVTTDETTDLGPPAHPLASHPPS